jgi:hypothetical protein
VLTALCLLVWVLQSGAKSLREDFDELKAQVEADRTAAPAPAPRATGDLKAVRADLARLDERTQDLLTALEFLAIDIDGIKRNTWDTLQAMQSSGQGPAPEMPDAYKKLFNPETKEALRTLAAEKGVVLKEDRVEVPAIIVQNRTMLEFFAVTTGGKEHEAVVSLLGNYDPQGERLPEGLAGMINACILALGYEPGKPVSSKDGKVLPPSGAPIWLYLEWDEGGETVRARAEDLVYNIERKKQMDRGKWVYVGSHFARDWATGESVYMADITGDIAATYSWPNTIIDNVTSEGSDDIYYVCYTPRIPKIGTKVTFVIAKEELPAKDFPDEPPPEEEGGSDK